MNTLFTKIKSWTKELVSFLLIFILMKSIISYIKSPQLDFTTLPPIEGHLIDQSTFSLAKWREGKVPRAKPILLYFWATWCPMCSVQSPIINDLTDDFDVLTFAVNSGSASKVKSYLEEQGLDFRVLNDRHRQYSTLFKVNAYPTIFLFDQKGALRFTEVGYTSQLGLKARLAWLNLTF